MELDQCVMTVFDAWCRCRPAGSACRAAAFCCLSATNKLLDEPAASRDVLDGRREADPTVHPLLVHRERWRRKSWFGEGPDRHHYRAGQFVDGVVHRGSAVRAEAEPGVRAFVTNSDVLAGLAADKNLFACEARLGAEDAAGPAPAGKAMADGDSGSLSGHGCRELAA